MAHETPAPAPEILQRLRTLRELDPPTHGGRVLSYVYDPGIPGLDELIASAAIAFLPVNGLDPTTFGSVAVLERDIVAFARQLTNGDEDVVGSVTSGGTESCLLAVKSAREVWRAAHGEGGAAPTLVAPTTAHAAFHKACDYFGLTMTAVDVDPATGTVPDGALVTAVDDLIAAGNPPALVVLSAPNYPVGAIDDVGAIAPAMAERGIPVHVDACVGGFVLPFYPEAPPWDFRVRGVRSISLDAHKYGYAPKGASIVLYRGRENHQAQYFACVDWPGYPVVNPTMLGSRSATALAAAWAVIHRLGLPGYRGAVDRIAGATEQLTRLLTELPGLQILGEPFGPLLAVTSAPGPDAVDPFNFVDALKERGFLAQAQPAYRNLPRSAHLTITPVTAAVIDELGAAITAAAADVRGKPAPVADLALVEQISAEGLPEDLAQVMATLEALPPEAAPDALVQVLAGLIDPETSHP